MRSRTALEHAEELWKHARKSGRRAARSMGSRTAELARDVGHRTADAARDLGHRTADVARSIRGRTSDMAHEYGGRTSEGARDLGRRASETAREYGHRTAERARDYGSLAAERTRDAGERAARRARRARELALLASQQAWERRPRVSGKKVVLVSGALIALGLYLRKRNREELPSWRGRVALVTGGTRGYGLLLARELAADGCALVICARDQEELDRAESDLRARGARVLAVQCDVGDEEAVQRMVEQAREHFGRIDVLINNAGEIFVGPVEDATMEDYRRAHDVIFKGALHCTYAVLPEMLRRGRGTILNVSSLGGRVAIPHLVPYDSAKFALQGFSEGLRAELCGRGIDVTTVIPGTMRTGSYRNAWIKGQRDAEYTWFSLLSAVPGVSMSAERAARAAIHAAKRGDSEVVVPLYARVLSRLHGIAPRTTSALTRFFARFLPEGTGEREAAEGYDVEQSFSPRKRRWFDRLTALGRRGGRRSMQPNHASEPEGKRRNVGDVERVASMAAGSVLLASGLKRGGALGLLGGALGAAFLARGATGRCHVYRRLGIDTAPPSDLRIHRAVTVQKSPQEAYEVWREIEQLPRFLRHVRSVERIGEKRSRWTVDVTGAPAITFEAEIVEDTPGERLEWRTLPDQPVEHKGRVSFARAAGDRGTVVDVDLEYHLEGAASRVYAKLLEKVTSQQVKEDLRRFKQVLETGEVPTIVGQPAGQASPERAVRR